MISCLTDQCYSNPCQNNGVCTTPSALNYICDCKPGFGGTLCETRQEKCKTAASDCGSGAWCVEDEVKDSYICVCPPEAEYKDPSGGCKFSAAVVDFVVVLVLDVVAVVVLVLAAVIFGGGGVGGRDGGAIVPVIALDVVVVVVVFMLRFC